MKSRIYISGPITSDPDFESKFDQAHRFLLSRGYKVINPAHLCKVYPEGSWDDYMNICLDLLQMADAIVLLPGWEESRGANREYGYALARDMNILDMETFIRLEVNEE